MLTHDTEYDLTEDPAIQQALAGTTITIFRSTPYLYTFRTGGKFLANYYPTRSLLLGKDQSKREHVHHSVLPAWIKNQAWNLNPKFIIQELVKALELGPDPATPNLIQSAKLLQELLP